MGTTPSLPAGVVLPLVWVFLELLGRALDGRSELPESRVAGFRGVPHWVPGWEFQTQLFNELQPFLTEMMRTFVTEENLMSNKHADNPCEKSYNTLIFS